MVARPAYLLVGRIPGRLRLLDRCHGACRRPTHAILVDLLRAADGQRAQRHERDEEGQAPAGQHGPHDVPRFTTSTVARSPSTMTQSPVSMMSSGSRSRSVTLGMRITIAPSAIFVVI